MYTKIETKDKEIIIYITQQYSLGTYFIINNNPSLQGNSKDTEEIFHKKLRINTINNNGTILNGTIISCKSKYLINDFKE